MREERHDTCVAVMLLCMALFHEGGQGEGRGALSLISLFARDDAVGLFFAI